MILAHYEIQAHDPERAAEHVAAELSSGTFTSLPLETQELRARFSAQIHALAIDDEPRSGTFTAQLTLALPSENVGTSLIALVTALAGNVFELSGLEALRLVDFELPDDLERSFPGPAFGVAGTRERCGLDGQPLIGTIVKPSVGLSVEQTAQLAAELATAGIDFIKDDELISNPPYSARRERVERVIAAIDSATGGRRAVVFAPNISDEIEAMLKAQEQAAALDTGAVMVCVHSVGLAGVLALRKEASTPLHGHRAGWGLLGRGGSSLGPAAHARIWRLAGIDQLHVGGLESKFFESDESVATSIRTCLQPRQYRPSMPVLSAGQWGGQLEASVKASSGPDLMCLAGGAIHGHSMGIAAGIRALRAAAAAAVRGETVAQAAETVPELAVSVQTFGQ